MKFGELVRNPQFGFTVIVGGPESLELPVIRGYITDLPDPARFLSEGTVVLSAGLWVDRPGGVERFTDALQRAGVSILVLGLIELGHMPDSVIRACRERGLVLATISQQTSFGSILDAIRDSGPQRSTSREFQDAVTTALAVGGLIAALDVISEELGSRCWVVDGWSAVVSTAEIWPASRALDCYVQGLSVATRDHVAELAVSPPASAVRIDAGAVGADGLLVIEGDAAELDEGRSRRVLAAATALRAEFQLLAQPRLLEREHASALLASADDETVPPGEVSALMRIAGLDPQEPLRVVTADVSDPRVPAEVVGTLLESLIAPAGARLVRGVLGARPIIFQGGAVDDDAFRGIIERATPEMTARLGDRRMRVASSDVSTRISELGHAVAIAAERLDDLAGEGPVVVADASAAASHRALLRALGERTRADFATAVLDPLVAYDDKHGASMIDTVRVFLDTGGSWQDAAKQLHVHPNTLRYRIARIEELLHRDLSTMRDRVDVYLALVGRDL